MTQTQTDATITAQLVSEHERLGFMPRLFGRHYIQGEWLVYDWMRHLSSEYKGGYWNFYELSNGGGYLAPRREGAFKMACAGNWFEGEVSADAAGIIATLYALNGLANRTEDDAIIERYYQLANFAYEHAENGKIAAAID